MPADVSRILSKELVKLKSERERIDRHVSAIRGALETLSGSGRRGRGTRGRASRRTRRRMSPAARKSIGRRMKAYWAKRKATAAKSGGTDGKKAKR